MEESEMREREISFIRSAAAGEAIQERVMRGSHFSGDFLTQEIPGDFFSCSQTPCATVAGNCLCSAGIIDDVTRHSLARISLM